LSSGFPCSLNAQFDPDAARTTILQTEWNERRLDDLADLIAVSAADCMGRDPEAAWNAIPLASEVPTSAGAWVRGKLLGVVDRLIDGAHGAATTSSQALASSSPELAILISCVGRKLVLKQRIEDATTALRTQKEQAEKANFDKTRFLAAASHDLRQPMHALGLFMGELQNRLETPEQRKIVEKVEESVTAMSGLLDSLLDISKLDAGVIVPQVQDIEISTLLRRLSEAYMPSAKARSIRLRIHTCSWRVRSDPILLERILMNLLGNAIRYTQEHGCVLLACRKRGDRLRFEVRDNGPGIPLAEQENIFREFVQLENTARDRSKGLGLGLPIVQRSAKLLNHPLYLCSSPGRGSVFALDVPRVPDLKDLLAQGSATSPNPPVDGEGSFTGRHVLVVDDDELVRNGTAGLVEAWGCRVAMAASLAEAEHQFEQSPFELVICDFRLPDGNGVELAEHIYLQSKLKPAFILVSGDTSPEVLKLVADKGMHLLHKPVRPAKLRSMMAFVLKAK